MTAAKNLEALINMEIQLKSQYEKEIKSQLSQIASLTKNQESLQATIEDQRKQLNELSSINSDSKRLEQLNRELNNRAEKLQSEVDVQKSRVKSLQKDLNEARQQIKTLEQYDAEKLKKNLVATKATLAEQRNANELLTKNHNKCKQENLELQNTLKELKAELEKLKEETEKELETTEQD